MTPASISDIKSSLKNLEAKELAELVLRLARHKKDNKELLSYLIFHSDDLPAYIREVKEEMDEGFAEMNKNSVYLAKKTIRKVLRITNKHIRYTGSKEAEIELLLHFCVSLKGSKLPLNKHAVLLNLYNSQVKKIRAAIATLHEDLQYEYTRELERLE
ncbi:hypothetical protein EPD60_08885 [Flaviaesturariibacter flavus]|uniref:Uncharacterized protein n=1 Tax=Flaviaesturariibacter flavus TaxID=2502780 RepID=A0A4R1BAV1_9BACT|nr:hypothetical protein [Flaviaesturariibacter flavus]TCJ14116.1 hypothetical protein EPD60_08885 [Flaviaesturariibacter flavus]